MTVHCGGAPVMSLRGALSPAISLRAGPAKSADLWEGLLILVSSN